MECLSDIYKEDKYAKDIKEIKRWLVEYPDLVRLSFDNGHLYLIYDQRNLRKCLVVEDQVILTSYERSFKRLIPRMKVVQTTHAGDLKKWKICKQLIFLKNPVKL